MLIPAFVKDFHSVSSSALVSVNTLFLAVSQKTQRMEINVKLLHDCIASLLYLVV